MNSKAHGFTLIEILVGIVIVTIIILAGFQVLGNVGIAKIKLVEKTRIEEEAYFASEKLFEYIKKGGTIDYEEYWDRTNYDSQYSGGHYKNVSGFGNGGSFYYCMSPNGSNMGTNGCAQPGKQKYGEYALQFIDYNSDMDGNVGDEDGDGTPIGDDDDLYLGIGPRAFSGSRVDELYLINADGNERTYFRWNVVTDSDAPGGGTCSFTSPTDTFGPNCRGTIEFLKLIGKDTTSNGLVDSWFVDPDFTGGVQNIIPTDENIASYWQSIFPNSLNISNVSFHLYPNKNLTYSWRDADPSLRVSPYLQLRMVLSPSWKEKRKIRGTVPEVPITTTLSLLDLDID